jgi:hypothetical protein
MKCSILPEARFCPSNNDDTGDRGITSCIALLALVMMMRLQIDGALRDARRSAGRSSNPET